MVCTTLIIFLGLACSATALTTASPFDARNLEKHCIVKTTSGDVSPLLTSQYPDVEQFLGIPFAQPPIGDLRFAPPHPRQRSSKLLKAITQPPGCPQGPQTINEYTIYEPGYDFNGPQSEDCLMLNVHHPKGTGYDPLPIIVFVYGGGFVTGAANTTYTDPSPWIQRSKDLIVVNIQYKVIVFCYRASFYGFPNSIALDDRNLGLRDIRFAVEWVKENAAAFGGDPSRIALWGHSAGSIATNAYTFSHPDDPIIASSISTSGTVFTPQVGWQSFDVSGSNFTYVAHTLGCTGSQETLLKCLQTKSTSSINQIIYANNASLNFKPIVDGKYVFANYTTQILKGEVAKQPAIIGNSRDEGERSLDKNTNPNGPNQTQATLRTIAAFVCPGRLFSRYRVDIGLPTWRYEWAGNFSNISPLPWMGSYHGSPLPFIFQQTNNKAGHPLTGKSTPFENAISAYWSNLCRAFAADPNSLQRDFDWPQYQGGFVNQSTDAVKMIPAKGDSNVSNEPGGTGQKLSSIEYGAYHEEYCAKVDPYLISQTLPPGLEGVGAGSTVGG